MADENKNDNSLEKQYQNLWDNMQQTNAHNFALIIGIVAASGAILTAAFTNLKEIQGDAKIDAAIIGWIFMSLYVITVPGQLLLNSNRRHIWMLSTYIRIFLEPDLEFLKWETNVAKRNIQNDKLFSDVIGNEYLITLLLNLTATIAASFSFYSSSYLSTRFKVLCIILAVLFWIGFSWFFGLKMRSLKRGGKIEEDNYNKWERIKDNA